MDEGTLATIASLAHMLTREGKVSPLSVTGGQG